jgi:hypothetical protein
MASDEQPDRPGGPLTPPTGDLHRALHDLSCRYARAADRRDTDAFVGVFSPDARLAVSAPGDPARIVGTRQGHDQLADITRALGRYHRTFHLLGQANYERSAGGAVGEVYCVAHHLVLRPPGAEDQVMYIRYADEYAEDAGRWRITSRTVQIDWTETRPADPPAPSP